MAYNGHQVQHFHDFNDYFNDITDIGNINLPSNAYYNQLPTDRLPGINAGAGRHGDQRQFTFPELVTMDQLYNSRRAELERTGNSHRQAWMPYFQSFEEQYGWRPTPRRFDQFERSMDEDPTFYYGYQNQGRR